MEKQQRQQVEKNMKEAKEKLESEMEDAFHEHQANLLRQGMFAACFGHTGSYNDNYALEGVSYDQQCNICCFPKLVYLRSGIHGFTSI